MSVLPLAHVDPLQCDEERLLQSTAALSTHHTALYGDLLAFPLATATQIRLHWG